MEFAISRKDLEILLSSLKVFESPKWELEQWATPSNIAATIIFEALLRGDITGKLVADLGCGTGILALGAAVVGAKKVFCVEIDPDALKIAEMNEKIIEDFVGESIDVEFVQMDAREFSEKVDTVVMNPPFGLERGRRHADKEFLNTAFRIADRVYSLHRKHEKSRIFLLKFAEAHGFRAELLGTFRFPLKGILPWHRKPVVEIEVDFYLFSSSRATAST